MQGFSFEHTVGTSSADILNRITLHQFTADLDLFRDKVIGMLNPVDQPLCRRPADGQGVLGIGGQPHHPGQVYAVVADGGDLWADSHRDLHGFERIFFPTGNPLSLKYIQYFFVLWMLL